MSSTHQDRAYEVALVTLLVGHFQRLAPIFHRLPREALYGRIARLLFDALTLAHQDGIVSRITVHAKLALLPDVGDVDAFWADALAMCGELATGPHEAEGLLSQVLHDSARRQTEAILHDASCAIHTTPIESLRATIAAAAETADLHLSALDPTSDLCDAHAMTSLVREDWQALERGEGPRMTSTGLRSLDILLGGIPAATGEILGGGMAPSTVAVVMGATKTGKTSLAHTIVRRMALDQGIPVLIASTEMTRKQVGQRLLMGEARIPHQAMKIPAFMNKHQVTRFMDTTHRLARAPITVWDRPFIHRKALFSLASSLHAQGLCDVLVIDHLQRMEPTPDEEARNTPRQSILRAVVADAKDWANRTGGIVIIPSQVGDLPDSEGRMPRPNETAECRTIAWEVDYALGVFRPHAYQGDADPHHARLALLASRVADTGKCDLWWEGAWTSFSDPPDGHVFYEPEPTQPPQRGRR